MEVTGYTQKNFFDSFSGKVRGLSASLERSFSFRNEDSRAYDFCNQIICESNATPKGSYSDITREERPILGSNNLTKLGRLEKSFVGGKLPSIKQKKEYNRLISSVVNDIYKSDVCFVSTLPTKIYVNKKVCKIWAEKAAECFNRTSLNVAEAILSVSNLEDVSIKIKRFIKIAKGLKTKGDFLGYCTIMSGVSLFPVSRLINDCKLSKKALRDIKKAEKMQSYDLYTNIVNKRLKKNLPIVPSLTFVFGHVDRLNGGGAYDTKDTKIAINDARKKLRKMRNSPQEPGLDKNYKDLFPGNRFASIEAWTDFLE